jgi:phosphate:Na+ symporter
MRSAAAVAGEVAAPPAAAQSPLAKPASQDADAASGAAAVPTEDALVQLKRCAGELGELRRSRRAATLGAVANGTLTVDAAIVRVDTLRSLEALAHHAWRSAAHLVGRGE